MLGVTATPHVLVRCVLEVDCFITSQGERCSYIMINRDRAEQSLTRGD